jgi:hypothetical protein
MILRRRLALKSRNHLDQNYKPSLHRFIFDGGVGAQESEAENAGGDEQAVDIWFLAVTIVEKRYVDAEPLSDFLELRRADPAHAFFVFLHLMRGEADISMSATPADRGLRLLDLDFGLDFLRTGRSFCNPKATARPAYGLLFYLCAGIIDLAQGPHGPRAIIRPPGRV